MDPTLFPFVFPKFPSSDDESSATTGFTRAELAAIVVVTVVLIIGIVGCVLCCVFRRKNIALRIGNNIQMFATGAAADGVNDA